MLAYTGVVARLTTRTVTSLASVPAAAWDALAHGGCPFLQHGFLRALELSGSVGDEAGWRPVYVLVEEVSEAGRGRLVWPRVDAHRYTPSSAARA